MNGEYQCDAGGQTPRGRRARTLHSGLADDERGAVFLMCLAGILIVLLMALMVYDAGIATKDKTRVQGAADFSAMAQANVNARTMNMLAYGNIAKRSIWAVHSLYPSQIEAYRTHLFDRLDSHCQWDNETDTTEVWWEQTQENIDDSDSGDVGRAADAERSLQICEEARLTNYRDFYQLVETDPDTDGDFFLFSGADVSVIDDGGPQGDILPDPANPNILSVQYYAQDLRAIDNYQRFLVGAAPWWGWTEQLMHGVRNGATITASFPPPSTDGVPGAGGGAFDYLGQLAASTISPGETGPGDFVLPVRPGADGTMSDHITERIEAGFDGGVGAGVNHYTELDNANTDDAFILEHLANNTAFINQSGGLYECEGLTEREPEEREIDTPGGGECFLADEIANAVWFDAAVGHFIDVGLNYTNEAFALGGMADEINEPWQLDQTGSQWLAGSSNLVIAYLSDHQEMRGGSSREKFQFVDRFGAEDAQETGQFFEEATGPQGANRLREMYAAFGYWGMARGEVSFTAETDQPADLWHPAWIGKLRPVSLPGEFDGLGFEMGDMFHTMLAYIHLAQRTGITEMDPLDSVDHEWDFARMEWMMRGMSEETVEGVPK